MTVARPVLAPVPPRRRWGLLLGVAVVVGAVAWLAFSSVGDALVYYQTPTELLARGGEAIGQQVRLGGLVKEGSLSGPATDLSFVLTDGSHEIAVHSASTPTSSFREGVGAVVEGRLTASGVFEASRVIVKHDENYVAPTQGEVPSHIPDGGA
ncbi:MAG TPA: cytochrome c maturation protein CcmE [Candidatus Limnocylindria bacterium]|nr:cytochrome c maturation protein CcmE [Candidatus Limnocylindria bacterium]